MLDNLIFIVLPYSALALFLCVVPYRYFANRLTWTPFSSQFLESKTLYWGAMAWHFGIIIVLLAHLTGFLVPRVIEAFLSNQTFFLALENVSLGLGLLALFGSSVLFFRRMTAERIKAVSGIADWLIIILLICQAATGVYISIYVRWGYQWYHYTAVPYLYSLLSFHPQIEYVSDFPILFKVHVAGAFLILGVLPFTKLVHLLYLPVGFLKDPPILYRWLSSPKGR
ncbi:MAG TPA: respiratory nitrate reductase subunit gamma [Thermodesulfovibrionales bacterium]|nr:respiratory nitrate reductase subunit gamma [Thermodesulfovibrionales bacterium]